MLITNVILLGIGIKYLQYEQVLLNVIPMRQDTKVLRRTYLSDCTGTHMD